MTTTALIVDEDEATIRLYGELLERAGLSLLSARNGLSALRLAIEREPDLIVMEVRLPLVSGIEVIRQIRHHPRFAQVPIIVASAVATADNRQRCADAGCTAYLVKPTPVLAFLATVRDCLFTQRRALRKTA